MLDLHSRRQQNGSRVLRRCDQHALLGRLGEKWAVLVMYALATSPERSVRFSNLRRSIEGITQRMLTVTLRHLERDGLVLRHYFPEVPPRVEYELSAIGAEMLTSLQPFSQWIEVNTIKIADARRAFDERRAESN